MNANRYAAHDYITTVRGYTRFHPLDSERLAHLIGALDLDLDVLPRPEDKHSVTANVSEGVRDLVRETAIHFRITPSELVRLCVMSSLERISGVEGAPEMTDELRYNDR